MTELSGESRARRASFVEECSRESHHGPRVSSAYGRDRTSGSPDPEEPRGED